MNVSYELKKLGRKTVRVIPAIGFGRTGKCGMQNKANRDAWLETTLARIPAGGRILDAGAGQLQYKRFCGHLDYVSQDFAEYDGQGDGLGLQAGAWDQPQLDMVCDITSVPEPDCSFDAVMCVEVLEHVPDPIGALRELARLLRPAGTLIITAPFCSLTHYSPYFYYTGYSPRFYEYWLGQLGFEIEELRWNGNYFEYLAQELRRLPDVVERFSSSSISLLEKLAIPILIALLGRVSYHNKGSEELLAYGLHIRARRKSGACESS